MTQIVYFSTKSGNTRRLVEKLQRDAQRIPFESGEPLPVATKPYVLIFPSYGGGEVKGAVPKPVIHFLNDERNRRYLCGVVGAGNTNFGTGYCLGAHIVARKCQVPLLHCFELLGTPEDVATIHQELDRV
ncbi:class Ib ribonucleoside-diphosphate reductase assembly flavoprotein NrdI [Halomonas llamarensis]|uniref:Protein NrdI n=1 Tax=Halomonas llamarensis TaxID=2945104 RepID=A0ABT0SMW9_9GAMM|nr:class Ib ribonucleoside-diphosphate reductase assembly flavoprotein NrdI [Halomonas llamarensis]MCL7928820.1 class Ib ribonucleoside-diphosphate reductase assembly flavoprotein NrdI [Halomonas llamarensis]